MKLDLAINLPTLLMILAAAIALYVRLVRVEDRVGELRRDLDQQVDRDERRYEELRTSAVDHTSRLAVLETRTTAPPVRATR